MKLNLLLELSNSLSLLKEYVKITSQRRLISADLHNVENLM